MATKVKSFVNQVLAQIQGDEDKVVGEKNYRKADAAVRGQISALEGKLVDAEIAVEEAEEALHKAKYPTTLIQDTEGYLKNISRKEDEVESTANTLANIKNSLKYFKGLNKEFNA